MPIHPFAIETIGPEFSGYKRAAFVEQSGEEDVTAEPSKRTAGRALSKIRSSKPGRGGRYGHKLKSETSLREARAFYATSNAPNFNRSPELGRFYAEGFRIQDSGVRSQELR